MKIFLWLIKACTLILEDKKEWDYKDVELLKIIVCAQVLNPEKDSKYFVDLPLKKEINDIINDFEEIKGELGLKNKSSSKKRKNHKTLNFLIYQTIFSVLNLNEKIEELDIKKIMEENKDLQKRKNIINDFLNKNFKEVGSDLEDYDEKEFFTNISQLPFMESVKDEKIREIVKSILHIWTKLSKKSVENLDSSLIPLKYPFIVPGGRFREFYYWDSLWILQGLLICDMKKAAKYLVLNFIDLINEYGFIPNGTRAYYSRRTQPPLFCMMLIKLYDYSTEFHDLVLGKGLEAAMKEYNFLKENKSCEIVVKEKKYQMYVYKVEGNYPRPESLKEDFQNWYNASGVRKNELYKSLKTSAESGIDFSSRWFTDPKDIKTIDILNRIPVDLNAIIYQNLCILQKLNVLANKKFIPKKLENEARMLKNAINELMWDEETLQWRDFVISENKQAEKRTYFSNFYPMIFGIKPPSCEIKEVYQYNRNYFMDCDGGVVAGEEICDVDQQWDYPNIWPPYNQLIIEFLDKSDETKKDALILAKKFFESVKIGFDEKNVFYEKYNTLVPGSSGSGGEYEPQSGFGWTNGTVLYIIQNFGQRLIE